MKDNTTNQDRGRSENDTQKNSNLPGAERENDNPATGIKNNDAWITGMEARTPIQQSNPTDHEPVSDNIEESSSAYTFIDPDEWKGDDDSIAEAQKTNLDTEQNNESEKENSF